MPDDGGGHFRLRRAMASAHSALASGVVAVREDRWRRWQCGGLQKRFGDEIGFGADAHAAIDRDRIADAQVAHPHVTAPRPSGIEHRVTRRGVHHDIPTGQVKELLQALNGRSGRTQLTRREGTDVTAQRHRSWPDREWKRQFASEAATHGSE